MKKLKVFSQKLGESVELSLAGTGVTMQPANMQMAAWSDGGWSNSYTSWLNSGWSNSYTYGWQNSGWSNSYTYGWTNSGWSNSYTYGWTNSGWNNGGGK